MGVITSSYQMDFVSCKSIFSQIREDLDSFDALGLIDNKTLYKYVKKVVSDIGMGCYMEKEAVLPVSRYKTKLPEDFTMLYSAYRCRSSESPIGRVQPQTGFVYYLENTCETIEHCKCDIEKVVDKITVRSYVNEGELLHRFEHPTLLSLSTGTRNKFCDEGSPNAYYSGSDQINIDGGFIHTNFESGNIYLKYYGFPFDENGLPMIPDKERIKTAIEDYIKYKLLEKWWTNSDVPDIERKMMHWQNEYKMSISDAKTEIATPSFETMVSLNNTNRNRFNVYQFNNM